MYERTRKVIHKILCNTYIFDTLFKVNKEMVVLNDDVKMASTDKTNQLGDIRTFFQTCRGEGILLNKNICELFKQEITYLGHK